MTSHLQRLITAGVILIALESSVAYAQSGVADFIRVPPVPTNLQVPEGNRVFLKGSAVGTQNYVCLPSGSSLAWTFQGPQATLFLTLRWITGEIRQQITTHYLSANPAENGTARPTWQSSLDTSAVWGKALETSTDPNFVAPGAIPWLLVRIVGSQRGPTGGTILTPTTFIHRVNTAGGSKPTTACSTPGEIAFVPYTTDYYFYRAAN